MPNSIIGDTAAINTNKIISPGKSLWDLTNCRRNTGAIHAAIGIIHLPFEKINIMIPAMRRIYGDSRLYFSLIVFNY
jgi:hypothetical protein